MNQRSEHSDSSPATKELNMITMKSNILEISNYSLKSNTDKERDKLNFYLSFTWNIHIPKTLPLFKQNEYN